MMLNIVMNWIGVKFDFGEGGEDLVYVYLLLNGDNFCVKIKQVVLGCFGVIVEYLNVCEELEIKVVQGVKLGEGGQLLGMKVIDLIVCLCYLIKGVILILLLLYYDIYLIEDLVQFIYDLKQINLIVKVIVKLVVFLGVGIIVVGVVKVEVDIILILGYNGGIGVLFVILIKYVGLLWEMGLIEVYQVLVMNNLCECIILWIDGGLWIGCDIVMVVMMGVEEYGIGIVVLIVMGCIMVCQCQLNICLVGVCIQCEDLCEKFIGNVDKVVNLIIFYVIEVCEIFVSIGVCLLDEVIGCVDLLMQVSCGLVYFDDFDLNLLLIVVDGVSKIKYDLNKLCNFVLDILDVEIVKDVVCFFNDGEKMQLEYVVQNILWIIGICILSYIVCNFGMCNNLQFDYLMVKFKGFVGQLFGVFVVFGLKIVVFGDVNDYVGKGLLGGIVVVCLIMSLFLVVVENIIIGNIVFYGVINGYLFVVGCVGECFVVCNFGVKVVVEGVGFNVCEYMIGGVVVIFGQIGLNFGVGMIGGMVYFYDLEGNIEDMMNMEILVICFVIVVYWEE